VKSVSHIIFMAFDGFAMGAHVNRGAARSDEEIELLCDLILGNERRSTSQKFAFAPINTILGAVSQVKNDECGQSL